MKIKGSKLHLPKAKLSIPKPKGVSFHPHVASKRTPKAPARNTTMSVHDVLKKYL